MLVENDTMVWRVMAGIRSAAENVGIIGSNSTPLALKDERDVEQFELISFSLVEVERGFCCTSFSCRSVVATGV